MLYQIADIIFHKLMFFKWFGILTKFRHNLCLCGFQDFLRVLRCFYIIKLRYQRGKPFDTRKPLTALLEHFSNIPRQASHGCATATPPLRYLSGVCVASSARRNFVAWCLPASVLRALVRDNFNNARLGLSPLPSPDTIGGNALRITALRSLARVGINNSCKVTRGLLIITEAVEPARTMVSNRRSGRRRFKPPHSVAARTGVMHNAVAQETKKDQGRCGQAVL